MIFEVENIQAKDVIYDFSSASLGELKTKSIYVDEFELFNNISSLDFALEAFQAMLCRSCGIENCAPGSWVSFRKFRNQVLIVPAVNLMREGNYEMTEYGPPNYIYQKGTLAFSRENYDLLRKLTSRFPKYDTVKKLSDQEMLGCHQLSVPGRIFGELGGIPILRKDVILAVSEGELEDQIANLELALQKAYESGKATNERDVSQPIEFYLDLPGFPTWSGMAIRKGNPDLILN